MSNSGIDVFLAELSDQNEILAQKINAAASTPSYDSFNDLQTQDNLFRRKIYGYSITPNPDITQTIAVAAPIATDARDKAATAKNLSDYTTEPNITLANQAISRANDLFNANTAIYNTTLATRVNIDASEMRYLARRLEALLAAYSTTPDTDTLNTLATALNGAIQSVTAVSTGSTTVLAARSVTLGALNATLPANANTIVTLTGVAISRTDALATAIESNGDNVLLETLKIADSRLAQAGTLDAATLKNTVDSVDYWATQTATYANDIARKARKRVNIPTVNDSSTSAYTIAGQLLASLDGSTGSIAALNDYIQAPGDSAKATAAQTAVNATQAALSNTIGSASTLETDPGKRNRSGRHSNTLVRQCLRLPETSDRNPFLVGGQQVGATPPSTRSATVCARPAANCRSTAPAPIASWRSARDGQSVPRTAPRGQPPTSSKASMPTPRVTGTPRHPSSYFRMPRYRVHSTTG